MAHHNSYYQTSSQIERSETELHLKLLIIGIMLGHREVHCDINNEGNIAERQKVSRPKVLGKEKLNRTVMADIGNSMTNTRQQTLLKTHNGSCKPFQTKKMIAKQKAPESTEKQVRSLPELPALHLDLIEQVDEAISPKHQARHESKSEETRVNHLVEEYADDISEYLTSVEKQDPVHLQGYLQGTSGCVKPESRGILIDWLVDVHQAFGLCPDGCPD